MVLTRTAAQQFAIRTTKVGQELRPRWFRGAGVTTQHGGGKWQKVIPYSAVIYDRYGKAGLKRGGFEPAFADFGSLSDIFAAFFGEDVLAGGGRQRSQRGGDVQGLVEIEL